MAIYDGPNNKKKESELRMSPHPASPTAESPISHIHLHLHSISRSQFTPAYAPFTLGFRSAEELILVSLITAYRQQKLYH